MVRSKITFLLVHINFAQDPSLLLTHFANFVPGDEKSTHCAMSDRQ